MALSRKMLKAMGIEDEKIDQIIDAHTETVNGLKDEIDKYKADAEKLPTVQQELDDLKAEGEKDPWKVKYDALKEDFESFKSEQTKKDEKASKESALKNMLKEIGVSDKRIDSVVKVTDLENIKVKDGKIDDEKGEYKAWLEKEWSDFIGHPETKGVETKTPPANTGGSMTKAEIMAIKDRQERRAAIANNIELFNGGKSNG